MISNGTQEIYVLKENDDEIIIEGGADVPECERAEGCVEEAISASKGSFLVFDNHGNQFERMVGVDSNGEEFFYFQLTSTQGVPLDVVQVPAADDCEAVTIVQEVSTDDQNENMEHW